MMKLQSFAVFLDRDGTIIEDRGSIKDNNQVEFLPGVFDALRKLQKHFLLFIVTNQNPASLTDSQVADVNKFVCDRLANEGIKIQEIYACNHLEKSKCNCRKPSPFFLKKASQEYDIDLSGSYVIGDHLSDIYLAHNAGAKSIYVLTGHGKMHLHDVPVGTTILPSLPYAVERILSNPELGFCTENQIKRAAQAIKSGQPIAFPTETVYGLGANAYDENAVKKIYDLKKRPNKNPLIVHIASIDQLECCATEIPEKAHLLTRKFWPGPLTIVLKKKSCIPDIVTSGLDSVAIRMPDHRVALSLIMNSGVPIAAPSANRFGYVSPTQADHVKEQFGSDLNIVLNDGSCRVGLESTIVSFLEQSPVLLRPGGISLERIESVIGTVCLNPSNEITPLSPGRLPSHYAPKTPLIITDDPAALSLHYRVGFLSFSSNCNADLYAAIEILSKSGDLDEAASNLYAAIQRLDNLNLDILVTTSVVNEGIGKAINDRLLRASRNKGTV
ncbi:MAG: L-threonylcarbamoyladenylate synthase [Sedimentisphaerales bacterium]